MQDNVVLHEVEARMQVGGLLEDLHYPVACTLYVLMNKTLVYETNALGDPGNINSSNSLVGASGAEW